MGKNKRVGILFSGGLDSTYLVWKNLADGNEVVPIYIEIINNEAKSKLEKNRIELLWGMFREEFKFKIQNIVYALKMDINAYDNLSFKQVPVWLSGLVYSQNHGVNELQIGYVGGDDALGYLSEIKKIYKSYRYICNKPLKKLVFPLKRANKYDMLEELPEKYHQWIVSCEAPRLDKEDDEVIDYTPCGHCPTCQKIMLSNNFGTRLSEKYRKCVVDYAFDIIREFREDDVEIEFDQENEVQRITRPYPCQVKAIEEAHQLYLPFEEESDMDMKACVDAVAIGV